MGRHKATTQVRLRVSPKTREAWKQAAALERLVTGKTAGQLLGMLMMHRRNYLLRLAKQRGIDVESVRPRGKSAKTMPESIDRIDPFI